jgi:hypothetical protein
MFAERHTSAIVSETVTRPRSVLTVLVGLLLFELIGWSALFFEWDKQLGFGVRFWGVVFLALAACLIAWFALRALVIRRGWFTLKEFLAFVLLIGCALGWAGHLYQQKREQRALAKSLIERGASVHWTGNDQLGFKRLVGRDYFHDIRGVNVELSQLTSEDFELFSRLPKLEGLQLYGKVTEDHLQRLRTVPSLQHLTLEKPDIAGSVLAPLQGHPRLWLLYIHDAPVLEDEALAPLPAIPKLTELLLSGVRLSEGSLVHVQKCANLDTLYLDDSSVPDEALAHLIGLRLNILSLARTAITDAALAYVAKLPSLTYLDLSGTAVTDAGMEQLKPLKHLKTLDLHDTAVTAKRVRQLESEMPNLHIVQD